MPDASGVFPFSSSALLTNFCARTFVDCVVVVLSTDVLFVLVVVSVGVLATGVASSTTVIAYVVLVVSVVVTESVWLDAPVCVSVVVSRTTSVDFDSDFCIFSFSGKSFV